MSVAVAVCLAICAADPDSDDVVPGIDPLVECVTTEEPARNVATAPEFVCENSSVDVKLAAAVDDTIFAAILVVFFEPELPPVLATLPISV